MMSLEPRRFPGAKRFLALPLLAAALLGGGCLSTLLPAPAPADVVYRLSPMGSSVPAATAAVVIRVDRPTAPGILMGQGIVVSPDGTRMATAGQARWAEAIPALVQNSFFDALSTRENLTGVLPTSGARTSYRAHLTIRNFEARFDKGESSAPLVIVHYTATVSDSGSRELKGTFDTRKTVRANDINVSAIVKAQGEANSAAMQEITDWLEGVATGPET